VVLVGAFVHAVVCGVTTDVIAADRRDFLAMNVVADRIDLGTIEASTMFFGAKLARLRYHLLASAASRAFDKVPPEIFATDSWRPHFERPGAKFRARPTWTLGSST
jgi:hypothetical protein